MKACCRALGHRCPDCAELNRQRARKWYAKPRNRQRHKVRVTESRAEKRGALEDGWEARQRYAFVCARRFYPHLLQHHREDFRQTCALAALMTAQCGQGLSRQVQRLMYRLEKEVWTKHEGRFLPRYRRSSVEDRLIERIDNDLAT